MKVAQATRPDPRGGAASSLAGGPPAGSRIARLPPMPETAFQEGGALGYAPPDIATSPPSPDLGAGRLMRVVVIDDVPELRRLYKLALRGSPFEVVAEAGNGRDGILQVIGHQPDLVLLDLSMPDLDGLECLLAIRRRCPDARVVVLSGFTRERLEPAVKALGASDYIEKGATPDELVQRLTAVASQPPQPFVEPPRAAIEALRSRMLELV